VTVTVDVTVNGAPTAMLHLKIINTNKIKNSTTTAVSSLTKESLFL
jgi:hypothetical protein